MQDLIPPLLALVAASAEVNAARSAPVGSVGLMPSRRSLASLASLRNAGQGAVRALGWAAGVLHSTTFQAHAGNQGSCLRYQNCTLLHGGPHGPDCSCMS